VTTLLEQIKSVEREIALRKRAYPRWVAQQRMSRQQAEREILAMEAVRETLRELARERAPELALT
jgi:hypothetical protein